MSEQLKLCPNPWCASTNTQMIKHGYPSDTYWVRCMCGVRGPIARTKKDAIAWWNTRVDPQRQVLVDALKDVKSHCDRYLNADEALEGLGRVFNVIQSTPKAAGEL